jgi:hypothetical protein
MDNEEYRTLITRDLAKGMQVYWSEILFRSHSAAASSILRSRKWIEGIQSAVRAKNSLAFAATLRGLIESAADTCTALLSVPSELAANHSQIRSALAGTAKRAFISLDLENILIHYSHGRKVKKGHNAPQSHHTRQVRDYLQNLEKGQVKKVAECYSELCDLTHAGASSVGIWFVAESPLEFRLEPQFQELFLETLLFRYEEMFVDLFAFAFNPALITLAVLNHFPVAECQTPALGTWDFSGIRQWRNIQSYLKKP